VVGFGSFEALPFFFTQFKKRSQFVTINVGSHINMCLIMMYVGHDNVVTLVDKYDNELLLPLLMEVCKPSMRSILNQNS